MQRISGWIAVVAALALVASAFLFARYFFQTPSKPADNFGEEYGLMLKKFDGSEIPLYEYRRQVVIAYAWASWCTYCGEELKRLAELKKTYGDKIQILAINRAEPAQTAKEYISQLGIGNDITLLLDENDKFFKSIGGYAMPEMVFIDPSGKIVFHQRGPIDTVTMQAALKDLLE